MIESFALLYPLFSIISLIYTWSSKRNKRLPIPTDVIVTSPKLDMRELLIQFI